MKKPEPVVVGDLIARAHRPPTKSDPRWSWRCRVYDTTVGRQRIAWSGRGTRREVELALIELRSAPQQPVVQQIVPSALKTVGQLLDVWYSTAVHGCMKESTQTSYRCHAKVARQFMGDLRLPWVTTAVLEDARRAMTAEFAPWSVRSAFTVTRQAWRWAVQIGALQVPVPVFPKMERRRVSDGYTPPLEDVWKLIDTFDPAVAPAARSSLIIIAATGCRPAEATRLTHADVDLFEGGVALFFGRHDGAKKTGQRRVPIYGEAAEHVRALYNPDPALRDVHIILRRTGQPISANYSKNLPRVVRQHLAKMEGVRPFQPSAIRRAAVDAFARSGVSAGDAAAILGHSVETMLTFYRQVSERDKALAIQRAGLGRRLGSPVVPLRNSDQEQSQFCGEPQPEIDNDSSDVSIVGPPDSTCSSGKPRTAPRPTASVRLRAPSPRY